MSKAMRAKVLIKWFTYSHKSTSDVSEHLLRVIRVRPSQWKASRHFQVLGKTYHPRRAGAAGDTALAHTLQVVRLAGLGTFNALVLGAGAEKILQGWLAGDGPTCCVW